MEDHFTLEILLGDPLIPLTTAVILLYMLHKRVSNDILILLGAFIFNINPLYVLIFFLCWKASIVLPKPKSYRKPNSFKRRKGAKLNSLSEIPAEKTFDFLLLGNSISTFYTAALLAKTGQKVCIILPSRATPIVVHPEGAPCPILVENLSVGKVDRYQTLLDAAQEMEPSSRATFAPIGSATDGYTHSVINRFTRKAKMQNR